MIKNALTYVILFIIVSGMIGHYPEGDEICYSPCGNSKNHNPGLSKNKGGVKIHSLSKQKAESWILLDNFFSVYFPNIGNFYETSTHGIAKVNYSDIAEKRDPKGIGYIDDMDTTEWTRNKWIKFPYEVLYHRMAVTPNGLEDRGWEQHESGEWFRLEVSTGGHKPTNELRVTLRNGVRNTAWHSAHKLQYVDVVGRIGNLIEEDTDDTTFSNTFKQALDKAADKAGWYINGLLKTVNEEAQNVYLAWFRNNGKYNIDVRGHQVSEDTGYYNTYGDTVYQPTNYFGMLDNRTDASGNETPEYKALSSKLSNYSMYLNWSEESGRRNYTPLEKAQTEYVRDRFTFNTDLTKQVEIMDEKGNSTLSEVPLVQHLTVPYGLTNRLGNLQLLYLGGRARTFVGNDRVTALKSIINGDDKTELLKPEDETLYYLFGQRWHLTLGTPSGAVYIPYKNGVHTDPMDKAFDTKGNVIKAKDQLREKCDVDGDGLEEYRYVILMTGKIYALGSIYDLEYKQGDDNGVIKLYGKTFTFGKEIPNLLAVYSPGNLTEDFKTMQTH